jgi:hypothetical protein
MELTKDYFDQQLRNLATKDDLKNLATKSELNEINNDVTDLKKFVQTNMVTKQELDDLREELPTRADFNKLQESVDGIAKQFLDQKQEQTVGGFRTSRMEQWIIKAASKIGVEYKP